MIRLFFNTKGKNAEYISEELAEFLGYIENSTDEFAQGSKAPNVRLLHEKVKQIKRDAKLEAKYMTVEEWMREREVVAVEQGMAQGMAQSILVVLAAKFDVSEELREKVMSQKDVEVLKAWITIATGATSIEEFIDRSEI